MIRSSSRHSASACRWLERRLVLAAFACAAVTTPLPACPADALRALAVEGATTESIAALAPHFRGAPTELGAWYRDAYRRKDALGDGRHAPRRALDILLSLIVDAPGTIAAEVAAGASPLDAYRKYLARVREIVGPGPIGDYTAEDVLFVARTVQRELQRHVPEGLPESTCMTLYGSFPNGRADIRLSDLDWRLRETRFLTPIWVGSQGAITAYFRGRAERVHLGFAFSRDDGEAGMTELARKNPVSLRVTPRGLALVVYATPSRTWSPPAEYALD